MKNVLRSFGLLFALAGLLFLGVVTDNKTVQVVLFSLMFVGVVGSLILGYAQGIGSAFLALLLVGGTWWAGSATIDTIDFDKPFFLSFYWSTVGYLLLTLVLLFLTVMAFLFIADDPKS